MKRRDFIIRSFAVVAASLLKLKTTAAQIPFGFWKDPSNPNAELRVTTLLFRAAAKTAPALTELRASRVVLLVGGMIPAHLVELRVTRNIVLAAARTSATAGDLRTTKIIMRVAAKQ